MTARGLGRTAARLAQAVKPATVKTRAADFARTLKAEYEAGKLEAEQQPPAEYAATQESDADAVADAMRKVDWAKVKAATSEKGADAAHAMKSMAAEVDWEKVQPVAAKVSSALIAAVASGQIGMGGRYGSTVARAIMNDRNLAQKVSASLARRDAPMPPDFRGIIDATATDVIPEG